MPYTNVRGARFHIADLAPRRPGEPVVMLHGLFTGSIASWYLTAAPAISATRRVRLVDWRGHGLSERTPNGYGTASMAADLEALTADLPPFAIVGHSYGCLVALRFLQTVPGRVRRMVLVEPPFNEVGLSEGLRAVRGEPSGRLRNGSAERRMRALADTTTVLTDLAAEPPVTDADLRSLDGGPCLVIGGRNSPFISSVDRVRQACPHVRAHELAGGHEIHVSHADEVTALVTGFLGPARAEVAHG
ncbi:alpha/beta fold hydrolase [Spirillospora sp. NPDC052269]